MNLKEMEVSQLEERKLAIAGELDAEGADLDALETEARAINAELEARKAEAAKKAEVRQLINDGAGEVIEKYEQKEERKMSENNTEALYRIAFLKNLAVRDGQYLFGDLTAEERAAFTHTTANSGNVVPAVMMNRIIELVESMSPMYEDATPSNMTQGFGVPRRTAISQGDATGVAEGTANDDEQNTFDLLTLDGIEIKKHVVITRKMKFKSIDAFESWVINELAQRIAVAKEKVILARLDGSAPAGGSAISGSGIAAANILTNQTYGDAAIRSMFALLKGQGGRVIYANSSTIWNHLVGIEGTDNKKLFVPNGMDDPTVAGRIYGATVRVDENLSDNVVYLGVKGKVLANDYDDLFIFSATEPKTANEIITGYSLFDAGLENPKSFVKATFTVSP